MPNELTFAESTPQQIFGVCARPVVAHRVRLPTSASRFSALVGLLHLQGLLAASRDVGCLRKMTCMSLTISTHLSNFTSAAP